MFETDDPFGVRRRDVTAKCPWCGTPHHYVEVKNPVVNDPGFWEVRCSKCSMAFFTLKLSDVFDSDSRDLDVIAQHEGDFEGDPATRATEVAFHNLDINDNKWRYNYTTAHLYECNCGQELDSAARGQLAKEFSNVRLAWAALLHHSFRRSSPGDSATVRVRFSCLCGLEHKATFYQRVVVDPEAQLPGVEDFLLADVTGASLTERLSGLLSKTDAMDLLEKLVVRWNLLSEQILVVSPFIGHQYLSHEQRLEVWEWLLRMLDPRRVVFVTRPASWKEYKKAMAESGIPVDLLEQFDLQNQVVASGLSKADSHAKFYAGVSAEACEVFSGSANLVRGPSMENATFAELPRGRFDAKYVAPLKLKTKLPAVNKRLQSVCIYGSEA